MHHCACGGSCCLTSIPQGPVVGYTGGGDNKLSRCIWAAGFGLTDPGYAYLSGNLLDNYSFDRYTLRIGGDAASMSRLVLEKLLAWRNTGFCGLSDDADQSRCLIPDKVRRVSVAIDLQQGCLYHCNRSDVNMVRSDAVAMCRQESCWPWLQNDEMIVSMVSTHHGAQTSETAEQAASAIELLSVVYRMYMQELNEVYPEVRSCQTLPRPDDHRAL